MRNLKCIFLTTAFGMLITSDIIAQKGDELLVYSLRGNVTVVEDNAEKPVKVGKVLKPGSYIKTKRAAKLTMVCKEGKPLSVTREGVFPVTKWKDSCKADNNSVTTKYFQFIWDQLYVRSDEYKKEHPQTETVLTDAPVRGQEDLELIMSAHLDTINYASGFFPITWITTKPYNGKYYVTIENIKSGKNVFADSSIFSYLSLDKVRKYMRAWNLYRINVSLKKDKKGESSVIRYLPGSEVNRKVNQLRKSVMVPEDAAAQYFRLAYQLRENKYAPLAYYYFKKAAVSDTAFSFYNEKLEEFKKDLYIE